MAFQLAGGLWALLFRALLVCTGVYTGPRPTAGQSPGLDLPAVGQKGRRSLTDSFNFLWQPRASHAYNPMAGLQGAAHLQLKRPCRRLFPKQRATWVQGPQHSKRQALTGEATGGAVPGPVPTEPTRRRGLRRSFEQRAARHSASCRRSPREAC